MRRYCSGVVRLNSNRITTRLNGLRLLFRADRMDVSRDLRPAADRSGFSQHSEKSTPHRREKRLLNHRYTKSINQSDYPQVVTCGHEITTDRPGPDCPLPWFANADQLYQNNEFCISIGNVLSDLRPSARCR
jgi:hypothetical protein